MLNFSKKRLFIPIAGDIFIRNFIDSGAFSELEKNFEIHYLLSSTVTKKINSKNIHRIINDNVQKRTLSRYRTNYLIMKRHQKRSMSFALKYRGTFYRHLSFFKKTAFNFLSLPGVCETFVYFNEQYLTTLKEIDQILEQNRPDFILIPSGFSDSFSIDCLKSAKKASVPHLLLMFNWDNVSCKGLFPENPDYLGVWGDQTQEQAIKIHRMKPENIFILGSPQFETYFEHTQVSVEMKKEILSKNKISGEKTVILYLGISRYRDEIALLTLLEDAIRLGHLDNVHILYRPHPWRELDPLEENFFDCQFQHISMDIQLKDHYIATKTQKNYNPKTFVPDYHYPPQLLASVDAVISSLTTMGIEAMIMGKPVLLPAFPDDRFSFSVDSLIQYDHHNCWEKFRDAIVCKEKILFIKNCQQLLKLAIDPDVSRRTKEDVKYVVFSDTSTYAQRLNKLFLKLAPKMDVKIEKTLPSYEQLQSNNP